MNKRKETDEDSNINPDAKKQKRHQSKLQYEKAAAAEEEDDEEVKEQEVVYHGERKCEKDGCGHGAYWLHNGQYLCGVHCSKRVTNRKALPVDPDAKRKRYQAYADEAAAADAVAKENREAGRPGMVTLYRMRMRQNVQTAKGFLNIFPNNRHGDRKDGRGMPSLSPMRMGPVMHNQTELPHAKSIENFHQGNKVYASQYDAQLDKPTPAFYETQREMYTDDVPHRHHPAASSRLRPLFSVFYVGDVEYRLSYVESRQLYCHYYEAFARADPAYKTLENLIEQGYHLQMCGYDAYDVEGDWSDPNVWEAYYLDPSRPFGHERVLACMLSISSEDVPWRKHKTVPF